MAKSPGARTPPDHGANKEDASFRQHEQPVDTGRGHRTYTSFEYAVTQAIAAAAFFLEFDGLIVPSARGTELNLVIFTEKLDVTEKLKVEHSEPVDWSAWRSEHRKRKTRNTPAKEK